MNSRSINNEVQSPQINQKLMQQQRMLDARQYKSKQRVYIPIIKYYRDKTLNITVRVLKYHNLNRVEVRTEEWNADMLLQCFEWNIIKVWHKLNHSE